MLSVGFGLVFVGILCLGLWVKALTALPAKGVAEVSAFVLLGPAWKNELREPWV